MDVEFEDLSPKQRTVRILAMGHPAALRRFQQLQHIQQFAEIDDWSRIMMLPISWPTLARSQRMTMLIKQLR